MKRAMNFIIGLAVGGVMGAAITLLLTPASGDELRAQMQMRLRDIQKEVQSAASARRAELEEQLAALRQPEKPELT
jgi:gas vesicle protein